MNIAIQRRRPFFGLLLLLITVAWALPTLAHAGVYQRIYVDVLSPDHVTVDRKKIPMEELPAVFRARIHGEDTVLAVIYVPLPVNKALLKAVMAKCREGGAKAFTVAYKS